MPPGAALLEAPGHRLDLRWLVRLRWGAIAVALVGLAVVTGALGATLPLLPLLGVLAVVAVTNVWLWRFLRRGAVPTQALVGGIALLDVILITEFLAMSGGPMNPFSIVYLVYVALAAVLLEARWTWGLVVATSGAFGALFAFAPSDHGLHGAGIDRHLEGMWVAFTCAAALLAGVVGRVSASLRRREADLRAAQDRIARNERLASLTTLAAGAAHELGTPLGTIAVVARELEDALVEAGSGRELADDARLIRNEVRRCRGILDQMSADAGELAGEGFVPVAVGEILENVVGHLPPDRRARVGVELAPSLEGAPVQVPPRAFARVLGNLVENALRASEPDGPVALRVGRRDALWRFEIADRGVGMAPETLARAGEPFYTTRGPGEGLGLGLFIARSCVERLGGRLALTSTPGEGTVATVELAG